MWHISAPERELRIRLLRLNALSGERGQALLGVVVEVSPRLREDGGRCGDAVLDAEKLAGRSVRCFAVGGGGGEGGRR
jgi:hypothetical protein